MPDVYNHIETTSDLLPEIDVVPHQEWLAAALDAVHACDEFLIDPINKALDAALESRRHITYAEFGRTVYWAETMRIALNDLAAKVEKIRASTHDVMIESEHVADYA